MVLPVAAGASDAPFRPREAHARAFPPPRSPALTRQSPLIRPDAGFQACALRSVEQPAVADGNLTHVHVNAADPAVIGTLDSVNCITDRAYHLPLTRLIVALTGRPSR